MAAAESVVAHQPALSPVWRRRTSRRRLWAMVSASYGLDVILVAAFAAVGTVPWIVPAAHLTAAAIVSVGFFVLLQRKAPASDPYYTVHQMAAATAVQLAGIVIAPQLALVFLNVLFIVFAFGALRLTPKQAFAGWLVISAGAMAALETVWPQVRVPHQTPIEMSLLAVSYSSTLARCAYVGLQGSWLREELQRTNEQLIDFSQRIERMAHVDELTGLMNRRAIRTRLDEQIALAQTGTQTLTVAFLDLDYFKIVNDQFGHAVGDSVLHEFSVLAKRTLRSTDHIGRYGGEEFLALLPGPALADPPEVMERIRVVVANHPWSSLAAGLTVTVSIGLAHYQPGLSAAQLLQQADGALYDAKRTGRDRVMLAA